MENPFQAETTSDVGKPIPLISADGGNHPPIAWADASVRTILNIDDVSEDRRHAAILLQGCAVNMLSEVYRDVIRREIDHLNTFVDHCDSDYDVAEIAEHAVHALHRIADGTLWHDLIHGVDWSASAYATIANHLSTAIHVERLLFGDRNPLNRAARNYRVRFSG